MHNREIYIRHAGLYSREDWQVLRRTGIMVAGMGGLGCLVAIILARSGIGRLYLIDRQPVAASDLNRQLLYKWCDISHTKLETSVAELEATGTDTRIYSKSLDLMQEDLQREDFSDWDFQGIADCLDNFPARFRLEELIGAGQFLVHGGVEGFHGQITTIKPGITPRLSQIFAGQTGPDRNILVSPAIVTAIGSLMTEEIIRNLLGKPGLLNKLLIMDLESMTIDRIELTR